MLKDQLNTFFVSVFYSILNAEERSLEAMSNGKVTLKEIHLIEAVYKCMEKGENNFSSIAQKMKITLGTLTTAYAKLEKKGYLTKERDKKDKRVYWIYPTHIAELINMEHTKWHERLVESIASALTQEEQLNLVATLKILGEFFDKLAQHRPKI